MDDMKVYKEAGMCVCRWHVCMDEDCRDIIVYMDEWWNTVNETVLRKVLCGVWWNT